MRLPPLKDIGGFLKALLMFLFSSRVRTEILISGGRRFYSWSSKNAGEALTKTKAAAAAKTSEAKKALTATAAKAGSAAAIWQRKGGFKGVVKRLLRRLSAYLKNEVDWRIVSILLLIFLFHAVNNIIVVAIDTAPPTGDEAMNFITSWHCFDAIRRGDAPAFISSLSASLPEPNPPLQRLISVPFYFLFGASLDVAILSTIAAALVLILSMYHIGKDLIGKSAGILAAGVTLLMPGVFAFSRTYYREFTLTAFVALSLALMLKSEGFSRRGYSLAFGASVGIGLLVRWSFPLYAAGPVLIYGYQSLRDIFSVSKNPLRECLRRGLWVLLAAALCVLIAGPWYIQNYRTVLVTHNPALPAGPKVSSSPLSVEEPLYYIPDLYRTWLGPGLFIILLMSLVPLLRRPARVVPLALAWFTVPFLVLTFVITWQKFPHILVPALPGLALLMSQGIQSLGAKLNQKMRGGVTAAVVLIALAQFLALTYLAGPLHPLNRTGSGSPAPDPRDWRVREVTDTLNLLMSSRPTATVTVMSAYSPYSVPFLQYLQLTGALTPFSVRVGDPCPCHSYIYFENLFAKTDVFLFPTYQPSFGTEAYAQAWDTFFRAWNASKPSFIRVREFTLPDGVTLELYARGFPRQILHASSGADLRNTSLHFTVPLESEGALLILGLQYQIYYTPPFHLPQYSVEVNGVSVANLSRALLSWEDVTIALPPKIANNGTLDIDIVNRADDANQSSIAIKEASISYW